MTDKEVVLSLLRDERWVSNADIASLKGLKPCISGLRRLRDLRAEGYPIIKARYYVCGKAMNSYYYHLCNGDEYKAGQKIPFGLGVLEVR